MYKTCSQEQLEKTLKTSKEQRTSALKDLMLMKEGVIDVRFLTAFSQFFLIDETCLCEVKFDEIITLLKEFYSRLNNKGPVILKEIYSPLRGYLSLQTTLYTDEMEGVMKANKFNLWETNKGRYILHVGNQPFTNEIIINLILNEILGGKGHLQQYDAFSCKGTNYLVSEKGGISLVDYFSNKKNFITDSLLFDISSNLLKTLFDLKTPRYGFNHSNLIVSNVFINPDTLETKMANFEDSSIYWNGIRFYSMGKYTPTNFPFPVKEGFYTLTEWKYGILPLRLYTVNNIYGFYLSFDIYTLFYSMIIEPSVWRLVYEWFYKNKPSKFLDLWKSLWKEEDLQVIMADIQNQHLLLAQYSPGSEEYVRQLSFMRDIHMITLKFYEKGYNFYRNIDHIYKFVGLEREGPLTSENYSITLSRKNKLVIEPGITNRGVFGDWSRTNLYSVTRILHDWDYIS